MSRIKPIVSIDTSYVFHMLSVAKCGYDNDYGKGFTHLHSVQDLKVLKDNENLLTVEGGRALSASGWRACVLAICYGILLRRAKPHVQLKGMGWLIGAAFSNN